MRYVLTVLIVFCGKFLESSLTSSRGYVSEKELECFSQEKIYHKPTDKCYRLLTTGPCRRGHWFVLEKPKEALRGTVNVTIKAKCARVIRISFAVYEKPFNEISFQSKKRQKILTLVASDITSQQFPRMTLEKLNFTEVLKQRFWYKLRKALSRLA